MIIKKQYAVISCILSGVILFYAALVKPHKNWDMIAYMAVTANYNISEPAALHEYVYEQLKQNVSPEFYDQLVTGHFRQNASQNPTVLMQQLPFYKIRLLYNISIYLLSKIGIETVFAIRLISAISTTVGLFVLCFTFKNYMNNVLLFLLPICGLLLGLYDMARHSTPDAMAFLFLSFSVCSLMRKHWTIFILLPLSILVRTDFIIYTTLIFLYVYLSEKNKRWAVVISAVSTIVCYIAMNKYSGNYGWSRLFLETLVNRTIYPADSTAELTFSRYFHVLLRNTRQFIDKQFLVYLCIIFIVIYSYFRKYSLKLFSKITDHRNIPLVITLISFIYIATHFLLFPVIWHRFFSGFYLLGLISFFLIISKNQYNIILRSTKLLAFKQEPSNEETSC